MTELETRLGTAGRPLRVAIIGAGPAGFYAAEALLKQKDLVCQIDFFEHLPTPFGLVRDGVAPDHQTIKAVTRVYDRILDNPAVRYFGNVTFGTDILHDDLKPLYDQIVYAVGAHADRRMNIPGEDLAGSLPATAFVAWYNGHPEYRDLAIDLSMERVVVVGIGNVAVDVARILVRSTDELAKTDIADYALAALRQSRVREVIMLGRRGPVQAAFTPAEVKELGELEDVDFIIDPADLELDPHSQAEMAADRVATRNVELLRQYADRPLSGAPRRLCLRFLVSPVEIMGQDGRMTAVRIERNKLVLDNWGGLRAKGTGQYDTLQAGMVLRSVGYRSVPLLGVPFDDANYTIMNVAGRVASVADCDPVAGEYCVGWVKRGPSGIIGTNKPDAVATVQAMMEDLATLPGISDENRDPAKIQALLRERRPDYVSLADWKTLDRYEIEQGAKEGRPRLKVTTLPEMLKVMGKS
ncbi:MAG: FAD-dependent oxidoreductase [Anaerolineae bacterium]|nr:FAD-dependent oxidoreductase [Anaerolineae bacterium]